MSVRAAAVLPAGGAGRRMGGAYKPLLEVAGEPLLLHALRPFLTFSEIEWVVVALPAGIASAPPAWLLALDARITLVAGGDERGASVANALAVVPREADAVLVHDAARPLVSRALVQRALLAATDGRCAIAAIPVTDTIKEVDDDARIVGTPDRHRLRAAQTPQVFPRAVLIDAYARAARDGWVATDDAALVARTGRSVTIFPGDPENIKVTSPSDLDVAAALLRRR